MRTKLRQTAWSFYGRFAWDRNSTHATVALAQKLVEILVENKLSASDLVLDVGCGTGSYSFQLLEAGFKVIGIDYAQGMLDRAIASFGKHPNLIFKQVNVSKRFPFEEGKFSHVICVSSIQTVGDPFFSLREIHRTMKTNGTLIVTHTPSPKTGQSIYPEQISQLSNHRGKRTPFSNVLLAIKSLVERSGFTTYWTEEELTSMVAKCGFEIVEVDKFRGKFVVVGKKLNPQ